MGIYLEYNRNSTISKGKIMSVVFIETPRITEPGTGSKATTGAGTTITLASGEKIPEVSRVVVTIAPNEVITADIHLHAAFKGTAMATFFVKHPTTGKDKAVTEIVFDDGSVWSAAW
jgi:hypothetical protein